ncbi:MAG: hypothetical protein PHD61_10560, partial [Bacteroidales bacterium]|nr:hypothetical protein [Lentimicrobiaceae bacterium]MDD5695728.1 hypothetical protein [Bacteroidales bacterium]
VVCSLGKWLVTVKVVMKSRMMGDYHVRFRERLGLKCPGLLDERGFIKGNADIDQMLELGNGLFRKRNPFVVHLFAHPFQPPTRGKE